MPKPISATKLARATELRNAAVDMVAAHGKMVGAKFMDKTIEIMAFENEHVAILYKTPRLNLDCPWAPASANPKGFLVDIFAANRKTFSVQWDNDEKIEVLLYKSGGWESFLDAQPQPPSGFPV
ncbi:hypothetical protein [Afipia sp. GAS231]|uniref:hypothetical protein n=1 Tax=Afipia sp. GAS231 TaxID=1882747 RepID=UPI00087DAA00|nr:hypothetical protein [Afipia sp. GAS231]SDO48121.1 hypothetical protein SAMN05444050_4242 [Afipia sp. GAS231]